MIRKIALLVPALACVLGVGITRAAEAPSPEKIRRDFHALLVRPKVPAAATSSSETQNGLVIERGQFASDAKTKVPFLLVKPAAASGKLPVVIVLHGTGGSKNGCLGDLQELAGRGILGIAIDARYQGERAPGGAHGSQEYQEAITRAWHEKDPKTQEHPFYYDTVYDLWRTVDYLQSRADVDGSRIGMIGYSMGGIETWLAAATDPRVKVAVPCIGVQSFRWSLENERWQGRANTIRRSHEAAARDLGEPEVNSKVCRALWNKIIPGILDEFDCPNMLRAIAPRPMLILNGEKDPNNPLEGAKLAFAAAEDAYRKDGAADHLRIDVAAGVGHAVTPEQHKMAIEWLVRWLSPGKGIAN